MTDSEHDLVETHQFADSRYLAVRSGYEAPREWLSSSPVCLQLGQRNIDHVGVLRAVYPFRVVRLFQSGTFMFACLSGRGEVMIDGRWVAVSADEACLLPPFVANAIRAIEGEPVWEFSWVRYREDPERLPVVSSKSPVKGGYRAAPLFHAVAGLHAECQQSLPLPAQCHLWIELIQGYVDRFAAPSHGDARLWRLWQRVEADLGDDWTLGEMARIAAMSEEQLRRLCLRELGRSPGKHVTFLRIQRACHLLATSGDKIEVIAREVGYTSPYTFSSTFKKWTGLRPSAYRRSSSLVGVHR
ncbi:MAG: AraC family transcriptional regulator [Verrucomicrobiota bacterium]